MSTSTTTLQSPAEITEQMRRSAETTYRESVKATARGEKISPQMLREAMSATGRSFDQFEIDLGVYQRRLKAAEDLAEAKMLSAEEKDLEREAREAGGRLADARKRAEEIVRAAEEPAREMQRRLDGIREKHRNMKARAVKTLNETSDPAIKTEADKLRNEIGDIQSWLHSPGPEKAMGCLRQREKTQGKLDNLDTGNPAVRVGLERELARLDAMIESQADLHRGVKDAHERIVALNQQILEIERGVMDPGKMRFADPQGVAVG